MKSKPGAKFKVSGFKFQVQRFYAATLKPGPK
jgi:hypothetical protein